jgi:translation initiation factor 2B subunit (eIF-2B alpha/beta/delta family)
MRAVRTAVLLVALAVPALAATARAEDAVMGAALQSRLAALSALLNSVAVPENAGRPSTADERARLHKVESGAQDVYDDARVAGDLLGQAAARQLTGSVYLLTGRFKDAVTALRESASLFRKAGDPGTADQVDALADMAAHPRSH